ncbi:MAG: TonB family protein [Acidobacteriaceae bacterium]
MKLLLRSTFALLLLPLVAVPLSFAWGNDGHKMINRLAAQNLPADLPAFMHTPEAVNEIEYLGPEPDRWRSRAEPELNAEQAPDHFIDLELADVIGTLPRNRYEYVADLYAAGLTHPRLASELQPDRVGFQPYITEEVWERLKSAMRDYRELSAKHENTQPVEAAILFYAGWLGHYVGDGSQPLHVTVNYDGWVGKENPNGYTTEHGIHSRFESAFVSANIKASHVQPLMTPLHSIGDEWTDYLAYLRHSATLVEKVYQLDKDHGFEGAGTPESRQFTAERLAAGASMLRDLIAAAWTKSAEPVPEWHEAPKSTSAPGGGSVSLDGTGGGFSGGVLASLSQPKTYEVGNGITAPKLIHSVVPQLSDEAHKAHYGGTCLLSLMVGADGVPRRVYVVRPLGMGLDQRAVEAVKQFRYEPATREGMPVPVQITVKVVFLN